MKILNAKFKNYRLLRDLELEFSTDDDKRLTVIRAANDSGKTTIISALQWCLYGDSSLPGKGKGYRMHPIDWDVDKDGSTVSISVTIEFEVSKYHTISGNERVSVQKYQIVRSSNEELDGSTNDWKRGKSIVKLFALTSNGAQIIDPPEAVINDELPSELREVFFTDGDRTLTFIDSEISIATKRTRVLQAIKSLLGLSIIEKMREHVKKASSEVNQKAKILNKSGAVGDAAQRMADIEKSIEKHEKELESATEQYASFESAYNEIDKKISIALQKGDKEALSRDREDRKRRISRLRMQIDSAAKEHSKLFKSSSLGKNLLSSELSEAFGILEVMHEDGKLPNTTIPILEESLKKGKCICGELLEKDDPNCRTRIDFINQLIQNSQDSDEVQEIITSLYYGASGLVKGDADWMEEYQRVVGARDDLSVLLEEEEKEYAALEAKIDSLPDTNIKKLRETKAEYRKQRDKHLSNKSIYSTELVKLNLDRDTIEKDRDKQLAKEEKGKLIRTELMIINDVNNLLNSAYNIIINEELSKVSKLMNEIFVSMIGTDPDQNAIINHALIDSNYDILVFGPGNRRLNPDRDLNGASRRALTLSFILALTKVSEVEAPNIIDTPLGMMSGFVKRSVLRTTIDKSRQLVLFLTRSEIADCEDIISSKAGKIITLTNPAHYPNILVNNPHVVERKVLTCNCTHLEECNLCKRRLDYKEELEEDVA